MTRRVADSFVSRAPRGASRRDEHPLPCARPLGAGGRLPEEVLSGVRNWRRRRHPVRELAQRRAVCEAVIPARRSHPAMCHALRHSFTTHLLENGNAIRRIQKLLGHHDVSTAMIYARVPNRGGRGVGDPLEGVG